jgi:hypothetical protein
MGGKELQNFIEYVLIEYKTKFCYKIWEVKSVLALNKSHGNNTVNII